MSNSNLLEDDGVMKTIHHYQPSDNKFLIETIQDVAPILKRNRELRNEGKGMFRSGDGKRVATLPNVTFHELIQKGIFQDPVRFKRWLNDPNNKKFRTSEGTV